MLKRELKVVFILPESVFLINSRYIVLCIILKYLGVDFYVVPFFASFRICLRG